MEVNDEVKVRLIKYLDNVEELVRKGADLAQDQLPAIAQEIIAWNRASTTVALLFSVGLVALGVYAIWQLFKHGTAADKRHESSEPYAVCAVFSGIVSLFGFIATLYNTMPCVKAWFAPRLVLLETLRDLVSHNLN